MLRITVEKENVTDTPQQPQQSLKKHMNRWICSRLTKDGDVYFLMRWVANKKRSIDFWSKEKNNEANRVL